MPDVYNSNGKKKEIDFIGIGAPRCGTTWISRCLNEHPEIELSKHKETNFFLTNNAPVADLLKIKAKPRDIVEYFNEFSNFPSKVRGEYSVYYLYDKEALLNIKKLFPKVKIFISIRDPISYLASAYWFSKSSHISHKIPSTFDEAIESAELYDLWNKNKAKFSKYISNCYDIFGRKNVLVILLDDIRSKPRVVLRKLYGFLGVDQEFIPQKAFIKVNESKTIRSKSLSYIVHIFYSGFLLKLFPKYGFYELVNSQGMVFKIYNLIFKKKFIPPKMNTNSRKKLLNEFKDDIIKIEKLTGYDLLNWYKV